MLAALVHQCARRAVAEGDALPEGAAQRDQIPVEPQERSAVRRLIGDVALRGIRRREPGRRLAEAAGRGRVPLHRVAERVAPVAVERGVVARAVGHADLVSLEDERRTRQREQEHCRGSVVRAADAVGEAREVVIREHPGRLAGCVHRLDRRPHARRLEASVQQLERERSV